jgi:hypothetical protein
VTGAINDLIKLRLTDPAAAEVVADRTQDFVKRFVSQQVAFDQLADVPPRGGAGVFRLLFNGPQLRGPQTEIVAHRALSWRVPASRDPLRADQHGNHIVQL